MQVHVAAALGAEVAVAAGLGVVALELAFVGGDLEGALVHHRDDRHGAATDIGAVGAQAVMQLRWPGRVLVAHGVLVAAATANRLE
ncbi:hypothetical protein D3C76_1654590 [compost metagenome]